MSRLNRWPSLLIAGLFIPAGFLFAPLSLTAQGVGATPNPATFPAVTADDLNTGVSQSMMIEGRFQRQGGNQNAGFYRFEWQGASGDPIQADLEYRLDGDPTWQTLPEGVESLPSPSCGGGNCTYTYEFRALLPGGTYEPGTTYEAVMTWTAYRDNDPNTPQAFDTQSLFMPVESSSSLAATPTSILFDPPNTSEHMDGQGAVESVSADIIHTGNWSLQATLEPTGGQGFPEGVYIEEGTQANPAILLQDFVSATIATGSTDGTPTFSVAPALLCATPPGTYTSDLVLELLDDADDVVATEVVSLEIDVDPVAHIDVAPGSISFGSVAGPGTYTAGGPFTISRCGNVEQQLSVLSDTEWMSDSFTNDRKPSSDLELSYDGGAWTPLPFSAPLVLEDNLAPGTSPGGANMNTRMVIAADDPADSYTVTLVISLVSN